MSYGGRRPRGRKNLETIINSVKNVVDIVGALPAAVNVTDTITGAVDSPVLSSNNQVERGSIIKAIHVSISVNGTQGSGVNNRLTFYIAKNPGNNLTLPNPGATGISDNKKWIFYEGMANLISNADGGSTFRFDRWLRVPKKMQRQASEDRFIAVFRVEAGTSANYCSKYIYKWYT